MAWFFLVSCFYKHGRPRPMLLELVLTGPGPNTEFNEDLTTLHASFGTWDKDIVAVATSPARPQADGPRTVGHTEPVYWKPEGCKGASPSRAARLRHGEGMPIAALACLAGRDMLAHSLGLDIRGASSCGHPGLDNAGFGAGPASCDAHGAPITSETAAAWAIHGEHPLLLAAPHADSAPSPAAAFFPTAAPGWPASVATIDIQSEVCLLVPRDGACPAPPFSITGTLGSECRLVAITQGFHTTWATPRAGRCGTLPPPPAAETGRAAA